MSQEMTAHHTVARGAALSVFASEANFENAQRMAIALSQASLVPKEYQGKASLPNVLIAMELASRIGASVLMVMQNLDVIHGRPSWRAKFLIATVNTCGKFTRMQFVKVGNWPKFRPAVDPKTSEPILNSTGDPVMTCDKPGDDVGMYAVARDLATGEEHIGETITMGLARAEGWASRNGSKWNTPMFGQMLRYRSATFWVSAFAPEVSMGMATSDEVIDVEGEEVVQRRPAIRAPQLAPAPDVKALEASLLADDDAEVPPAESVDPTTGEVTP